MYNECVTIHLPGSLDTAVFVASFNEILRRHEEWRTCFPLENGQPVQKIQEYQPGDIAVINLEYLPVSEREPEAFRLALAEADRPFDLAHGPLVRPLLIQLNGEDTRLFLALHHLIFDGFSLYQVLLPELHAIYSAFLRDQPSPLAALPIQYADFATWQREHLDKETLAPHLAYWKKQLADAPMVLNLPTDHPRPQNPAFGGSMYTFALSKALTNEIKGLARRENVTLFMTIVATFQTLLYRYSGQEDILIGTAISDRRAPEVQNLLGFFLNMVVLRTKMSDNPTFSELLQQVRMTTLEAHTHQDVPFEYLVEELQPERALGQNPLFQVVISLEPPLSTPTAGWTLTQMDVKTNASKFDLYLELDDRPDGLIGRFVYSSDLFERTTIARMVENWQVLLNYVIANPDQRISSLPLLSTAQRQQMLLDWNATNTSYPRDRCVHQLFEQQVEQTPDATALVLENQSMTYRELNERANQLAHHLRKLGVGPEVPVGLCMHRSFAMLVAMLGILKAGGAYVPLDPSYPRERLAFMLMDSQAPVLITQKQFLALFPQQALQTVLLDASWQTIARENTENPPIVTHAENLAYIMYTSGSTGKPKAVEILHRNIVRLLFGTHYAHLDATQTFLHMASISFDAATFEIWGALLHGARCVLFPEPIPTPRTIATAIHDHGITIAWITASLFNTVIDEVPSALKGLRQLLTGGEALSVPHMRRALDLLPDTQLINGYGPTECTTFACCYVIPRSLDEDMRSIPIGTPIGNTQAYILDKYLNLVPIGVPGELYLGGDGLARGYRNQPALTAEKFVRSPFDPDHAARLYKTGDLARYGADGTIEFVGRIDQQVKIRGFRVELGEIESVLSTHPGVREALVLMHEDERHDKHLIAYVVTHEDHSTIREELHTLLKTQLPEYMLPSDMQLLDKLPLTANGKLDHKALPVPDVLHNLQEESYVAPNSLVQQQLVQLWEELLHIRPIGIQNNFFYLGGHSLLAARLVDRIERDFGKKIALATLFAGPTIEQLANAIQAQEDNPRVPVVAVQVKGSRQPFFYLHGSWHSGAFYCFSIARSLEQDQPFYVLEPYQYEGLHSVPTLAAIAKAHLASLQAVQAHGPYRLGGFCNGGLVAYEMARQLQARGEQVELLVMIDPAYPPVLHQVVHRVLKSVGKLLHLSAAWPLNAFLRLRHTYKYLLHQRNPEDLEEFNAIDTSIVSLFPTMAALREDNVAITNWIVADYDYAAYMGDTTILQARQEPLGPLWRKKAQQADNISVQSIPGTHVSCRTEYVQELGAMLRDCLNAVGQKTTKPANRR